MRSNNRLESGNSKKYLGILLSLVAIIGGSKGVQAQAISQIRGEVRAAPLSSESDSNRDRRRNRDDDDDDDDDNNFVGELISSFLFGGNAERTQAASGSSDSTDIDYEIYSGNPETSVSFLDFPYADGQWGGIKLGPRPSQQSRLMIGTWYGTDFDNVDSWNAHITLDNPGPLGLDFQWSHLTEKLTGLPRDSLNVADLNLTYRWIESPELISRIGGGINLLTDRFGTEVDYNFTLSADFFPTRPWIVCFELDHGEIGAVHQTHLLSTIGLNYRHVECLVGYEYRRIGRVNLDGPLLGLKFWW